jgi:glutamine amidotransferase-like uncharacterized protein
MGTQGKRAYLLGEGPSPFFIGALEKSLKEYGFNSHFIERLKIKDVKSPTWQADAAFFCIPGGADKEYSDKMKGKPFAAVRSYVADGGTYLGICGGAYVASDSFVFDLLHLKSIPKTVKTRELKLFPGMAIGPDYTLPHVHLAIGIVPLSFVGSSKSFNIPYHMGCYFEGVEENGFETVAHYENGKPAIIQGAYQKGKVILCGPHPELELPAFQTLFTHATEKSKEREKVKAILRLAENSEAQRIESINRLLDLATTPSRGIKSALQPAHKKTRQLSIQTL